MIRVAIRNLARNRWRSALTAGGIAIAVGAIVWTAHMFDSMMDEMVHSATSAELGDAQIHSAAYLDERNLYNTFDVERAKLDVIRALDGVTGAAGRVLAFGLVGHEEHSQVAKLIGVEAVAERRVTETDARVLEGAWLSDSPAPPPSAREVVLGKVFAKELNVAVGDELVVILQAADGGLGNDKLQVVGIVGTGNSNLDRMGVYMHLADLQWLTALEGRLHEVAIRVQKQDEVAAVVATVRDVLGTQSHVEDGRALVVRSWTEIVPELHQMIEMSRSSSWIMYFIIYFIAAFGIFNTQRMTALERRREFGILLAIGTLPGRLARTIIAESTLLTLFGGLAGISWSVGLVLYHQANGFVMATDSGEGLQYMGVSFGDRLYFSLDLQHVIVPMVTIAIVGVLCGLWPAYTSGRLNITQAISGRQ